jgi:hypothetical protein
MPAEHIPEGSSGNCIMAFPFVMLLFFHTILCFDEDKITSYIFFSSNILGWEELEKYLLGEWNGLAEIVTTGNLRFAVRHGKGPKTHGKVFAVRFSSGRTAKSTR